VIVLETKMFYQGWHVVSFNRCFQTGPYPYYVISSYYLCRKLFNALLRKKVCQFWYAILSALQTQIGLGNFMIMFLL